RQFHLSASVYLRRLASLVRFSLPEFHDRISEQAENDYENSRRHHQDEARQVEDRLRRRRDGSENVRRAQKRMHSMIHGLSERLVPAKTIEHTRFQKRPRDTSQRPPGRARRIGTTAAEDRVSGLTLLSSERQRPASVMLPPLIFAGALPRQ